MCETYLWSPAVLVPAGRLSGCRCRASAWLPQLLAQRHRVKAVSRGNARPSLLPLAKTPPCLHRRHKMIT
ncbi:hypothetical protein E2C01_088572 [Portunus trituberculatus]|uniref:Uncharacterized protein n=1 Tax=Portunus trituberculatus TaxID=210409 RepID=A0A5B7JFT1_PORTR|nr:hypothetical protein [Portunus trituberculatus]